MPESMRLQYIDSPKEERLEEKTTLKVTRYDYQRAYFLLWIHLDLQDLI
jgi:hypothetical protein